MRLQHLFILLTYMLKLLMENVNSGKCKEAPKMMPLVMNNLHVITILFSVPRF